MKPMLAETVEDLIVDSVNFNWPMIASPKLDGIRTLSDGSNGPLTRTLKPIPNKHVRELIKSIACADMGLFYTDGELTHGSPESVTDKDIFNKTTRAIMTQDENPYEVTYFIFDKYLYPELSYSDRFLTPLKHTGVVKYSPYYGNEGLKLNIVALEYKVCNNVQDVIDYEEECVAKGYEGIMLRDPTKPYKYGRSTLKSQHLLKVKRFADAEAQVIGYEEQYTNLNPKEKNELGNSERSGKKEGLVAAGTLGALEVRAINGPHSGLIFRVGSGFNDELRQQLWNTKPDNLIITYKYQPSGEKDLPRFPVFKAIRKDAEV